MAALPVRRLAVATSSVCVLRRPLKHGDKRGSAGLLLPSARLPLEKPESEGRRL